MSRHNCTLELNGKVLLTNKFYAMSDYGAAITLTKKDKSPVTQSEKDFVMAELEKIKAGNEFSDVLGGDFLFQVNEFSNDNTMLHLVFSQYWYGEGDNEENFEFAKDNDLAQVEEIGGKLQSIVGETFDLKPDFENW